MNRAFVSNPAIFTHFERPLKVTHDILRRQITGNWYKIRLLLRHVVDVVVYRCYYTGLRDSRCGNYDNRFASAAATSRLVNVNVA